MREQQFTYRKILGRNLLFVVCCLLFSLVSSAQTTTKEDGKKTLSSSSKKVKILVIPWEPRMFNCNSDISHAISSETSQKYDQIEESLRRGMMDQMKHSFGPTCNVITLLDDTLKMTEDLHYAYTVTSMSYVSVNSPLNPTKADSAKMKQQSGVSKGQIEATTDETDKFMNTVIISPNLLEYLKKKYGVEYVVFINEVDMDNDLSADPYNFQGKQDFKRIVTVHWTIFNTTDGKRVAMGKNKASFSSTTNNPKKISDVAFATIGNAMYAKYVAAIKPKE
jgi:hypothetical protein